MMTLYVWETIVAIFLILIFLFLAFVPEEPKIKGNLEVIGLKALKTLDQTNELRKYAMENDTENIKNKLSSMLPYGIEYEILVCDYSCPNFNLEEKTTSVSYLLAGDVGKFKPKEVVLLMW
ncbi:MAG: hypothetical protein QW412_01010 [Candidatus Aenigmatarchaeota archaeon]